MSINCVLLSGGLFQIYSNIKENYISYEDMKNKLIKSYIKDNPNISKIFTKYENIKTEFNSDFQKINSDFIKDLELNIFSEQKNNFETMDLSLLYSFFSKFQKIYFCYDNLLYLLFDMNIFSLLNIETNNIIFCLNFEKKEISNIKNYLIFDTNLSSLLYYHKLGFFTIYLSHLVKMDLYQEEQKDYIDNYNKNNLNIINTHGFFFDFAITFMVQIINYIKYIKNYEQNLENINGKNLSEKIMNKTGAINIILIYRFFWKKGEIKRINFFLCNDDILYSTYVGDNKNKCYEYFNKYYINNNIKPKGVLAKLSSKICINDYNVLIEDLIKIKKENKDIKFFNNVENTKKYLIRGLQIDMIKDFINTCLKEEQTKVKLPKSIEELYINLDSYDKFDLFLKKNNINFPLMLKFSGERKIYDHLIINILCENGLKNFIDYFKNFTRNDSKEKIKIVIQKFVNHGGYVIKLYRIKNKSYFYYRPSFPDAKIEFISKYDEYKNGFLELLTSDLVSSKYQEFWKKINGINQNYKNNVNENFLENVGKKFEEYSGDTLLGLDFLLDKENNEYYLIDVNQFPGYKELNKDMGQILLEHILFYIKK